MQRSVEFFSSALADYKDQNKIYVTEKRHGANFSFVVTNDSVQHASRNGLISNQGDFYKDYEVIVEKYQDNIVNLFHFLKKKGVAMQSISVFGEMFGGYHPLSPVKYNRSRINKGVIYTADIEFEVFDIAVRYTDDTIAFLSQDTMYSFCEKFRIPTVPLVKICDSLLEALSLDPNFYTPAPLDMYAKTAHPPMIENNYVEGCVIKPNVALYEPNGSRIMLKMKSKKFLEKKKQRVHIDKPEIPQNLKNLMEQASQYITLARFENVVSKDGHDPRHDMELFGRVLGSFTKDVIDDFLKEADDFISLGKSDQKIVTKEIAILCASFLKGVVNIPQ